MLLNLKPSERRQDILLEQRLPLFIKAPCSVDCHYQLHTEKGYFLLHMQVKGALTIVCQRCLSEFIHDYNNATVIALCLQEETAEKLMSDYECSVIINGEVELSDLILDELHLYAPQKHADVSHCCPLATNYLGIKAPN
ncbi:MAG: hypothetical protein A3F46_01600 [Legionellales bacterium RIFCSPHIGHO2_12_FULL_42_9]|nr:MAG: hypothetical protein A3F46_01600 [Legionellales bacterium RIFCSPHIGHO2_12_FULL_42_9]